MTDNQLIEFAKKLQNNMITKTTEQTNNKKDFREKLSVIDSKLYQPKRIKF